MTETLTIPIIAGLAVGVAFIVIYAVLFQNNNNDGSTGSSISTTNDISKNQATSFSDSYPGINQTREGLVTIRDQQYYFSTLDSNVDIRKVTLLNNIDFHGVSFSFPDSPQLTPAGICIIPAFQFQDGSYEKTGYFAKNPEG